MKNLILTILVYLIGGCSHTSHLSSAPIPTVSISKNLIAKQLNSRTFAVKDTSFYESNVLVSKMPDGTVLVSSSPIDTVKAEDMLNWIYKNLNPKKIIAINTHFHADGTGGNEAYNSHGVEIWSSYLTKSLYSKRAESMQIDIAKMITDKKLKRDVLQRKNLPATNYFKQKGGLEWNFGGEKVIISFPGPAHTADNLIVFLPDQKILFGGCILKTPDWDTLGNINDADIKNYYKSVKSLEKYRAEIVIPGHGKIGGPEIIEHTKKLALAAQSESR